MGFGVFLVADTSGGKIYFGLEGERVGLWIFMKFIGYHSHERHVFFRSTWEWCLAHGEVLSCACRGFLSVSRDPQDISPCAGGSSNSQWASTHSVSVFSHWPNAKLIVYQ